MFADEIQELLFIRTVTYAFGFKTEDSESRGNSQEFLPVWIICGHEAFFKVKDLLVANMTLIENINEEFRQIDLDPHT